MRFCTEEQHTGFLRKLLLSSEGGVILVKYWLEGSKKEQERRFAARREDPMRQCKLSPMNVESWRPRDDYTRAREQMLRATDTPEAPWHIIRSEDKKKARLNCIWHFLSLIPVRDVRYEKVKLPKRPAKDKYDSEAGSAGRRFVPNTY